MAKENLGSWQRYTGIFGVLVVWLGIALAMHQVGLGFTGSRPISYLGIDPVTKAFFSGILLVSACLFVNFAFYVKRAFRAGNRFLAYFLIGQAGQITAALSPDNGQITKVVHTVAAFTLAFSFPLLIQQFTRSQKHSRHYAVYLGLLGFELVTFSTGMGLFIFTKGVAPLGETLAAIGFHLWIIAITLPAHKAPT